MISLENPKNQNQWWKWIFVHFLPSPSLFYFLALQWVMLMKEKVRCSQTIGSAGNMLHWCGYAHINMCNVHISKRSGNFDSFLFVRWMLRRVYVHIFIRIYSLIPVRTIDRYKMVILSNYFIFRKNSRARCEKFYSTWAENVYWYFM